LPIDFIAAAEIVRTDIRYLSAARIGPRASFAAFLRSQHAKEGGRLSVTKLADRKYRLDYLD
jgi:hypothetical protein